MRGHVPVQRFSTSDLPAELRREVAEAVYAEHVRGSIDMPADRPFAAELRMRPVADVQLALLEISPVKFVTPPDDRGILYLGITLDGGGRLVDRRRGERSVVAGDICAMRGDRDYVSLAELPSRFLNIAIPYHRVLPRLTRDAWSETTFSSDLPAARLLRGYAAALLGQEEALGAAEQAVFAGHIADLAALMLGASRDAEEQARQGGVRAARRQAVKADVLANLGNPALALDWLAQRHALSGSYIRALFYDEGTSFTDFVADARLDRVAAALRDPRRAGSTVAALALAAGFGDVSWFNQLFRRRFGMTPSEMRALSPDAADP